MQKLINAPRNSSGFTMIEILITVVVVSIGLLGLAGLQMSGLRANMGSEARSKAAILANDIAERMHANPLGVDTNEYEDIVSGDNIVTISGVDKSCDAVDFRFCSNNGGGITPVPADDGCTPAEMAFFDAWVWTCGMPVADGVKRGGVVNQLLNGSATVICDPCVPGSTHTISVGWSSLNPDRSIDANNVDTLAHTYTLVMVP